MKKSVRDRLLEKAVRVGDCLEWPIKSIRARYGTICIRGGMQLAHRASYVEFIGPIPAGMCVCHKCDNTRCIEPAHLFIGTQADNLFDMRNKKRGSTPQIKKTSFTSIDREFIDLWKANGYTYLEIAKAFKSHWKHLVRVHRGQLVTLTPVCK